MANSSQPPHDDYDSPWKEALVKYLPDFFTFFYPEIGTDIDWSRPPVFLDKELRKMEREANLGKREADALIKVYRADGEEVCVLAHIEVQAQHDSKFSQRMFISYYRIHDLFQGPVCSLAVFADKSREWRPSSFTDTCWGTKLSFEYSTRKLQDYNTSETLAELEQSKNPFAHLVVATLHAQATRPNSKERMRIKWRLVRNLYTLGLDKDEVRSFFRLIDWVLTLSPKLEKEFNDELQKIEEENKMTFITSVERIGIEKGLEKGREEGRREAILDNLEARFGQVPNSVRSELTKVTDQARLRELIRLAATVESLEDFQTQL